MSKRVSVLEEVWVPFAEKVHELAEGVKAVESWPISPEMRSCADLVLMLEPRLGVRAVKKHRRLQAEQWNKDCRAALQVENGQLREANLELLNTQARRAQERDDQPTDADTLTAMKMGEARRAWRIRRDEAVAQLLAADEIIAAKNTEIAQLRMEASNTRKKIYAQGSEIARLNVPGAGRIPQAGATT